MTEGTSICITNELARIVGLVATKHPDHSIEIVWREGSDDTYWGIVASNGRDEVYYVADDEQGSWSPAGAEEVAAIRDGNPLVYPLA